MENYSIPNHGINQDIVLLSNNFQKAHVALHGNIMVTLPTQRDVESINTLPAISLPRVISNNSQGSLSLSLMRVYETPIIIYLSYHSLFFLLINSFFPSLFS